MEYGDVEWGNCTKDNSELLERVQIEAARINTGLRVNSSKSNLYKELVWEPLQARWTNKLTLFYESINGIAPQYISDLIKPFLPTEQFSNLTKFILSAEQLLITTVLFHQQSNSGMS